MITPTCSLLVLNIPSTLMRPAMRVPGGSRGLISDNSCRGCSILLIIEGSTRYSGSWMRIWPTRLLMALSTMPSIMPRLRAERTTILPIPMTIAVRIMSVRRGLRQRFRHAIERSIFFPPLQLRNAATGRILTIFKVGISAVIEVTTQIMAGPMSIDKRDRRG